MSNEHISPEKLPLQLTVISVLIAVVGLVLFMVNPDGALIVTPSMLWGIGALLGLGSPLTALHIGMPQQAQFFFGVASNCFFLAILNFVLSK